MSGTYTFLQGLRDSRVESMGGPRTPFTSPSLSVGFGTNHLCKGLVDGS